MQITQSQSHGISDHAREYGEMIYCKLCTHWDGCLFEWCCHLCSVEMHHYWNLDWGCHKTNKLVNTHMIHYVHWRCITTRLGISLLHSIERIHSVYYSHWTINSITMIHCVYLRWVIIRIGSYQLRWFGIVNTKIYYVHYHYRYIWLQRFIICTEDVLLPQYSIEKIYYLYLR